MTGCNNLGKFRCDDNEICLSADGYTETVSFSLFGLADVPVSEEILAAGGATLGLAAIAPTTPGLFGGGLGFLGQPGVTFGGGGILPTAALAVILIVYFFYTYFLQILTPFLLLFRILPNKH